MTNLVYVYQNRVKTDSKTLAKAFDARHADILRKIDGILAETESDFNERNFASVEYVDAKGEKRRMFRMTRDGFFHIARTFTGPKGNAFSVQVITEFSRMEEQLLQTGQKQAPSDPLEMLRMAVAEIEKERARADAAEEETRATVIKLETVKQEAHIGGKDIDNLYRTIKIVARSLDGSFGIPYPKTIGHVQRAVKLKFTKQPHVCTFKDISFADLPKVYEYLRKFDGEEFGRVLLTKI